MAGSYPDVPGRRMAIDDDGSVVFVRDVSAGSNTTLDSTAKQIINNESGGSAQSLGTTGEGDYVAVVFPEKRNIAGVFADWRRSSTGGGGSSTNVVVETSTDSTNGIDGSWTTFATVAMHTDTDAPAGNRVQEAWRSNIAAGSVSGATSVRVRTGAGSTGQTLGRLHIYGAIATGETPQRLAFVTPAGDPIPADQDYGDIPQGSTSESFTFRLVNVSETDTAEGVTVGIEGLTGTSNTWYTFSIGGGGFQSSIEIESIGPEAQSGVITVRRTTPGGAALGLHAARIQVDVDEWT